MAKQDLILLHAPSVYDFRKEFLFYGPVSDLVPSTPVFEMYPFGFMTIAAHLHKLGYKVRIVNLASMMLNDPALDVPELIGRLESDVFGIDLHWLPHAHGALEIAKIVREKHPDSKVLMGGYSATYYHDELIRYPQVDLVMRGDSTEIPVAELLESTEAGKRLSTVQNLSWKDGAKIEHNPMTFVPEDLDYIDVDYGWIVRSVIKHRDLEGHKPFRDWDRYPLTAVFTVRGCYQKCVVCGGSCSAMRGFLGRQKAAFRSPEKVAADIHDIQDYLKAPTFVVGDVRRGGKSYQRRFFKELKELGVDNHLVLELFTPANEEYFKEVQSSTPSYSIEFSPDSHSEEVREALGRSFATEPMERTVVKALNNGARRFDVFFMIGLPKQTKTSALESAMYSRHLYGLVDNDPRLFVFSSPLAPFIDPGSYAFENPEKAGYTLFARTLEEHRIRLASPSWKYVLSYETKWMSRDEIVDATYDAADILNDVRFECGLIDEAARKERAERTAMARDLLAEVDRIVAVGDQGERALRMAALKERCNELMESTICAKRDLEWQTPGLYKSLPRALVGLMKRKKK
ncbi:MAG: TIGR04190 family B12-binding domain/radical SAM domain protein [Methanomassiliicoccales archaeon]|nr:TIGR04190 family B12-binding domain/radical SAM domain protein [Methanomassiliicoccales archaeon]